MKRKNSLLLSGLGEQFKAVKSHIKHCKYSNMTPELKVIY
jgi:hypothetical protein